MAHYSNVHTCYVSRIQRETPAITGDLPRGRNNLPQFHRNISEKNCGNILYEQIVRNLPYWVRIIGLFLAGYCLKCFSQSPHNE
jgi:hypothetical protein